MMPQTAMRNTDHENENTIHRNDKHSIPSNHQPRQMPRVEFQYGQRPIELRDIARKSKATDTQHARAQPQISVSSKGKPSPDGAWWTWPPSFLAKGRSKREQNGSKSGRGTPSSGRPNGKQAMHMRTEQRPNLWEEVKDIFRDPFNQNQKEAAARQRARVAHARANAAHLNHAPSIYDTDRRKTRSRLPEGEKADLPAGDRRRKEEPPITRPPIVRKPVPVHSKTVPRHTVQIIHPPRVQGSVHHKPDAFQGAFILSAHIRQEDAAAPPKSTGDTLVDAPRFEASSPIRPIQQRNVERQTTMSHFIRHSPLPSASALNYAPPDSDISSQPCDVCGKTNEPGFVWTATNLWLCEPCRENASPIELPPQTNRKPMPQPMVQSSISSRPVSPISRSSLMSNASVVSEEDPFHWFNDDLKPQDQEKPQFKWDDTAGHWQNHIPGLSPYTFHSVGTHLPFAGEEAGTHASPALPPKPLKYRASSIYPEDLIIGEHEFPMPPMPAHVGPSNLAHDARNSIHVAGLRADAQARKSSASKETLSRDRQSSFYGFWDPILKEKLGGKGPN